MTEIPFGDVLDCFVADDAILLVTSNQCILMRNNLDEIKRQPNKFILRDTAQSSNQEHTLLFSHLVPKEQLKSKEFGNRFKLRQQRKLDSGSLVQRMYFDTKQLELTDCPGE